MPGVDRGILKKIDKYLYMSEELYHIYIYIYIFTYINMYLDK